MNKRRRFNPTSEGPIEKYLFDDVSQGRKDEKDISDSFFRFNEFQSVFVHFISLSVTREEPFAKRIQKKKIVDCPFYQS